MKCKCGNHAPEGAKFCPDCGFKLPATLKQGDEYKPDRVYTVATALTDYFQGTIGEAKLRQEIRKGRIPHVRIGTKIILRKMALDAWAAEQERQSVIRPKGRSGLQGK